jgi:hypothetical protein
MPSRTARTTISTTSQVAIITSFRLPGYYLLWLVRKTPSRTVTMTIRTIRSQVIIIAISAYFGLRGDFEIGQL